MSKLIEGARAAVARWAEEGEGYIIAFSDTMLSPPQHRTLFAHPHSNPRSPQDITGTIDINEATIYPTYQSAVEAAAFWVHTRKPDTRIIRVRRRSAMELFEDYPTNLADALAEL